MGTVLLRSIVPTIVLLAGIAAVVYGAMYHTQTVTVEQEVEIDLGPPPGFGDPLLDDGFGPPADDGFGPPPDDGFGPPPDDGFEPPMDDGFEPPMDDGFGPPPDAGFGPPPGDGFGAPGMGAPPPFLTKIKETIIVPEEESEASLIREITIGGVTLLAEGILRRTYSGEPPSLCPT
jgi:hypothetical protein